MTMVYRESSGMCLMLEKKVTTDSCVHSGVMVMTFDLSWFQNTIQSCTRIGNSQGLFHVKTIRVNQPQMLVMEIYKETSNPFNSNTNFKSLIWKDFWSLQIHEKLKAPLVWHLSSVVCSNSFNNVSCRSKISYHSTKRRITAFTSLICYRKTSFRTKTNTNPTSPEEHTSKHGERNPKELQALTCQMDLSHVCRRFICYTGALWAAEITPQGSRVVEVTWPTKPCSHIHRAQKCLYS